MALIVITISTSPSLETAFDVRMSETWLTIACILFLVIIVILIPLALSISAIMTREVVIFYSDAIIADTFKAKFQALLRSLYKSLFSAVIVAKSKSAFYQVAFYQEWIASDQTPCL